jgi:hypothetical protein
VAQVFLEMVSAYQLLLCSVRFLLGRIEPALVTEPFQSIAEVSLPMRWMLW